MKLKVLHNSIQNQEETDISESKSEYWTAAKLSQELNWEFCFILVFIFFHFLISTVLKNCYLNNNNNNNNCLQFAHIPKVTENWLNTKSQQKWILQEKQYWRKNTFKIVWSVALLVTMIGFVSLKWRLLRFFHEVNVLQ